MSRRRRRKRKPQRPDHNLDLEPEQQEDVEPRHRPAKKVVFVEERIVPRLRVTTTMVAFYGLSVGFSLLLLGTIIKNRIIQGIGLSVFIPAILLAKGVQQVREEDENASK